MVATGVESRTQTSRSGMNATREENRGRFGATTTAPSGQALVKESKSERIHSCFGSTQRSACRQGDFEMDLRVAGRIEIRNTQQRRMYHSPPSWWPQRSVWHVVLFDSALSQSTVELHCACSFGSSLCTLGVSSRTGPNPTHSELMDPRSPALPVGNDPWPQHQT